MDKEFNYYLTQRGPGPGSMPMFGLEKIEEFPEKKHVPEIGCDAYARLSYKYELSKKEVDSYELIPESYEIPLCRAEISTLSHMLEEMAMQHLDKGKEYYAIYKKFERVLEE